MSVCNAKRHGGGAVYLLSALIAFCLGTNVYAQTPSEQEQLREEVKDLRKKLEALEKRLQTPDATTPSPAAATPGDEAKSSPVVEDSAQTNNETPVSTVTQPLTTETQEQLRGGQSNPGQQGQSNPQPQQQPQRQQQPPPNAPPQTVGEAPQKQEKPPEVAPIFQQPGVLTPKGKVVFEPSLQYAYATNDRVAIVGFTVIPALTIGLIDVRTVNRTTWTAAVTTRYGVTNRFEIEARIPYVYRQDSTIARPIGTGSATDQSFSASGQYIGDIEMTGRYQFNDGGLDKPYYIGTLRLKSRTGRDPFEVTEASPFLGPQLVQNELPTGTGFYGIQPGLTVLFPSDPAVFFGSVTYLHNFKRDVGSSFGKVDPGDIFGFNFGMGLALNDKASFSVGYDHASVQKPKQNGQVTPNSQVVQLGTLLLGFSYRLSARTNMNLALGLGVTRDAPDLQLTVRFPMRY